MTKILVIGLEGATIERLLGDAGHTNFVRLAESGCYGPLIGYVPPTYEAAWMAFAVGWTSSPSLASMDGLEVHPTPMPIWQVVAASGQQVAMSPVTGSDEASPTVEHAVANSRQRFADAKAALATGEFGYFQFIDIGGLLDLREGDAAYYEHLDRELGALLETLSDDTVLLVVALVAGDTLHPVSSGGFILSAANLPVSGELSDVTILDLSPALLALAGLEIPPSMHGRSFITGSGVPQDEDEELSDEARQLVLDRLSGLGYL